MRREDRSSDSLFSYADLESRVPRATIRFG